MVAAVNTNDPRVRRTRQLLQSAFMTLVHEKSFDAITVHDIAERATVNRATFYAHFADKYALVDATLGASFTELLVGRLPSDAPLNEAALKVFIVAVCDFHRNISKQCIRTYQALESSLEPRIIAHLHLAVRTCLERTPTLRTRDGQMREAAATVISWSIYGAALQWYKAGGPQSAEAFAEMVYPLIAGGISAMSALGRPDGGHIAL